MTKTYTATICLGLKEGYDGTQHTVSEVLAACKDFCEESRLCVSVTPTNFCYPGGSEKGCFVQLIQYPRFIIPETKLLKNAKDLALLLRVRFNQIGVTIITTKETLTYYNDEWVENIREAT